MFENAFTAGLNRVWSGYTVQWKLVSWNWFTTSPPLHGRCRLAGYLQFERLWKEIPFHHRSNPTVSCERRWREGASLDTIWTAAWVTVFYIFQIWNVTSVGHVKLQMLTHIHQFLCCYKTKSVCVQVTSSSFERKHVVRERASTRPHGVLSGRWGWRNLPSPLPVNESQNCKVNIKR